MRWNEINIRTNLNVWETLEDIDIDFIKEYIELKENKNKDRLKEFKTFEFETYVDIDKDDFLNEIWDSEIRDEAENRGFIIKDDEDYDTENYEEYAKIISEYSAFDLKRFFEEFMKNKRIYDKEKLIEFIENVT